ncbi:MAG: glycosyltransferase family 2 protein [Patescibacteria group bacterium]
MPLISVNIITHNRAKYISDAISSVLKQKFQDFELIVVDDASSDNTSNVIAPFLSDQRVKYFLLPKQKNIAAVRNFALEQSSGKYIAILDSDDLWCDDFKLSKQYDFLENNRSIVLVGTGAIIIDSLGEEKRKTSKPTTDSDIKKNFLLKNPFFHSSVLYRKEIIMSLGGYGENLKYCDDFDLWLRLNEKEKFYNFPDFCIKYREHDDNESAKNFWRAVKEVLLTIGKYRKNTNTSVLIFIKKIFDKLSILVKKN